MIGNRLSHGETGYTILEEGELDRQSFQLRASHYLICRPNGETLDGTYTLEQAQAEIERLE